MVKKMHFLLSSMSVVYVLTTIPEDGDDATMEQLKKMDKWDNDDYVCRGLILNGMSGSLFDIYQSVESSKELWDSLEAKYMAKDASSKKFLVSCIIDKLPPFWKDFKHTLKHLKEELTLVELGSYLRIEESLKVQDSDKPKGNNVAGPSVVNMVEHDNLSRYNDNKGKHKHHDNTRADPNKKAKPTCWKCDKTGHIKRDCKGVNVGNKANGSGTKGLDDDVTWWVDSGATIHVCKDRCCFKTYDSLNDGSILHMGNKSTTLVYGRGCVYFRFSSGKIVLLFNVLHVPNIRKNLVSRCILNNCGYKQVIESNKFILSKHGMFIGFGYLSNQMFMLNIDNDNIASAFLSTSKLNNSILWHARLSHVHFKRMQDMSKDGLILAFDMDTEKTESRVLGAVVRLPVPKLKTLGERGIECIFVGYAEHSKAFRFYVIEPNESVLINYIIESMYEIFDENRFSSVPRPILRIPNRTKDIGGLVVPQEVTEEVVTQQPEPDLRKGKRNRTPNNFGPEFQLCLIEGTRDDVFDQHSYFLNIEDDPKTFDEAMKSQDVAI
ncbi:zinc finger, CCHC-type containing protein [Tanacetum coccineum]